jgi:hypothetical protein
VEDGELLQINDGQVRHFPFQPALHGPFAARFYARLKELNGSSNLDGLALEKIVREEVEWAVDESTIIPMQRRVYRATWLLLRDLVRVGWSCHYKNGILEVVPPTERKRASTHEEVQADKEAVRRAMSESRQDRILEAREFIRRMENPPPAGQAQVPVTKLIADGKGLAADMSRINNLPDQESQLHSLRHAIKPYLQLVRENERCPITGHRLSDLWRYFRLTWSTPAETTPGRTLLYLVRDASHAYHPVMGIASLENAPLQITCRDTYLGWTVEAFQTEIEQATEEADVRAAFGRLLEYIAGALAEISTDDLCSPAEVERPTREVLQRLASIATRSAAEREAALRAWRSRGEVEETSEALERSSLGNISTVAEVALYRRKRAEQLGRLLSARQALLDLLEDTDFEIKHESFLDGESGRSAVRTALHALKSRHVGTSMLEVNVCGAVPPYNELLAGKLTALLMLSPQVVADYRERYGGRPSAIASRMKGELVIRPAELIFVGTSSLYRVGASQYNRLKLPRGLLRSDAAEVRWRKLGETTGHGTLHISRLTLQALEEAAGIEDNTLVSHTFGEGASPKLRTVRAGVKSILEPGQDETAKEVMRHANNRLVYGAWLATNGPAIFRGEDGEPEYYFDTSEPPKQATERIIDYWRERWLLMRIAYSAALDRISQFDQDTLLVSHDLPEHEVSDFVTIPREVPAMPAGLATESDEWRDFVRNLYRGYSAYADRIDKDLLEAMHVETPLDEAVIKAVTEGKSVVLTGNPGDGKTHLLRVLENRLRASAADPVIELDASAISDSRLQAEWAQAEENGKAFCVAINEAVLFKLADEYKHFAPLQEARRQVEEAVLYDDDTSQDEPVVVFDLSRRNVLSQMVVTATLDKLTDPVSLQPCARCPAQGCDLVLIQNLLRTETVRERLQILLDRVSRRGYHATLRELQALVSYLLFGGRDCDQLLESSGDLAYQLPQLCYGGEGKLFDALKETFDPADYSHPIWDEALMYGSTDESDWLPEWPAKISAVNLNSNEGVAATKRSFYFFHARGEQYLALASDDESAFAALLEQAERKTLRDLVGRINSFFGADSGDTELQIWQGHRYNQSPRRILYSAISRPRREFSVARPVLRRSMRQAFDLAEDHVLLYLNANRQARLRVDFPLFRLLAQADRGVPAMSLEDDTTRRLWQFMELLSQPLNEPEVDVQLLDTVTGERLFVGVDMEEGRYLTADPRVL